MWLGSFTLLCAASWWCLNTQVPAWGLPFIVFFYFYLFIYYKLFIFIQTIYMIAFVPSPKCVLDWYIPGSLFIPFCPFVVEKERYKRKQKKITQNKTKSGCLSSSSDYLMKALVSVADALFPMCDCCYFCCLC